MSNISDERLIVAAVKSDCEAVEELKTRIKPRVCDIIIKGARSYKGDMDVLVDHTLETVINSLDTYRFRTPFHPWLRIRSINTVIDYMRQHANPIATNNKRLSRKSPSKTERELSRSSRSEIHLPLERIDLEVRSLISLLNRSLDIRTINSCSGHPDQKAWKSQNIRKRYAWNPLGGWISFVPTGDPRCALDFIIGILTRLDNTNRESQKVDISLNNAIYRRYQQVMADALFYSGIPIVIVEVYLRFFVCVPKRRDCLEIWKYFITAMNEALLNDKEFTTKGKICNLNDSNINTPEAAAKCLQQVLHQLPFIFSAKFDTDSTGYPGILLRTKADLDLLKRFSSLANYMHKHLEKTNEFQIDPKGESSLTMKWTFHFQPFLNQELIPLPHLLTPQWEPRTREDHLKIWKLLENTVAEQLEHEGVNTA